MSYFRKAIMLMFSNWNNQILFSQKRNRLKVANFFRNKVVNMHLFCFFAANLGVLCSFL